MKWVPLTFAAAAMTIAATGFSVAASSPGRTTASAASRLDSAQPAERQSGEQALPVWSRVLRWTPFGNGLRIDYDSASRLPPLDGAYKPTNFVTPAHRGGWHSHTWKLTSVDFAGRQNYGADLRLVGHNGIAIHRLTLTLRPPGAPSPEPSDASGTTADIIFDAGHSGAGATNTGHGMTQVAAGGNVGDSRYTAGRVAGLSAETFTNRTDFSYIYLRLSRRGKLFRAHPTTVYATVTYATPSAAIWPERTFAALAARGVHYAQIYLNWAAVEPSPDRFDFQVLDRTLANAAKAHVRIMPVFLFCPAYWGGLPTWIKRFDVGSSGTPSEMPAWWSPFNRRSYFAYVTNTIRHVRKSPGFGGAFLDFGWLDYMWGPAPGSGGFHSAKGVNGYAPADVARFRRWLPSRYRSLDAFNRRYGTRYTSWALVPAAAPSQRLFRVYQHFRNWSVAQTYRRLTALVRRETKAPLYYYVGGGFFGAGVAFNLPDTFFRLARRYHAAVCLDDADRTGLGLLFGSLARAYGVPLFNEWSPGAGTPPPAYMAMYLSHYGFGEPEMAGMDFLPGHGGWATYLRWIPVLGRLRGVYPSQPVAVYIAYRPAFTNPLALAGMAGRLARIWLRLNLAFSVVTDREVRAGVVRLGQFRAILPLNGRRSRAISGYAARGGHVLDRASQLVEYAPPYLTFAPADSRRVEVIPTVDRAARSAWIALSSSWPAPRPYSGVATIHLDGLGLPPGRYHIVNAATGRPIASFGGPGVLQAPLRVGPGDLLIWRVLPGLGAVFPAPPGALVPPARFGHRD